MKSRAQLTAAITGAVAPHWGAWIEITSKWAAYALWVRSHPTGVRGLK